MFGTRSPLIGAGFPMFVIFGGHPVQFSFSNIDFQVSENKTARKWSIKVIIVNAIVPTYCCIV